MLSRLVITFLPRSKHLLISFYIRGMQNYGSQVKSSLLPVFGTASKPRMLFIIFNDWGEKRATFCDIRKIFEIQILVCIKFY